MHSIAYRMKGSEIYDRLGNRLGYLRDGAVCDATNRRLGYVRGSAIFDAGNRRVAYLRDADVYSASNNRLGRVEELCQPIAGAPPGAEGVALVLLLCQPRD